MAKVAKAGKAVETKSAKKAPKAAEAKSEKKSSKASLKAAEVIEAQPQVDPDELEEQQDAAAASSSGGGNAAALAAAAGSTEMSASFKNFRHHPDMESFYRFIYENDLRHEAMAIIDVIQTEKLARKAVKHAKTHTH